MIGLKDVKIMKICYSPIVLFESNGNVSLVYVFLKKVCVGFVRWFLNTLLLLKVIFSVKRCYVGVLGILEKCKSFAGVLVKSKVFFLKCVQNITVPVLSNTHYLHQTT